MQFKIKSASINISFSFFVFFLFCVLSDKTDFYLKSLFVSLIHETVHIVCIIYFGESVSEISFNIFGGKIEKTNRIILSNKKEAFINLSAPVFNVLVGIVSLVVFDASSWGYINLFTGIFNLLPFYNFDGGRGIFFLLSEKIDFCTSEKILFCISLVISLFFIVISFVLYSYNKTNFAFILMSLYMIVSLFLFRNL